MKINLKETVVLALLGTLMFCSKILTESLPNIHMIAMLTIAYTVVFRAKALYAIFVFIMLTGLFSGFGMWWVPYWYIWPLLWGITMLLPKNMSTNVAVPVYMIVACLHGLMYGTIYAPFQALVYGLDFNGMVAWIVAGLPWDAIQGVGNLVISVLTVPVIKTIKKAMKAAKIQ